jgi:putative phosphoribosyl transferase
MPNNWTGNYIYKDRREAGVVLAKALEVYRESNDTIVLGLARGGIPVAYEVARTLQLPLDVFIVRKLGVPGHEELAMGAIASGGIQILNTDTITSYTIPKNVIEVISDREYQEILRREKVYRDGNKMIIIYKKTIILVDDGLATGSTMRVAIESLRKLRPKKIVVAVPVGSPETCNELKFVADEIICARTPDPFVAVGLWYKDFSQTTDEEVRSLLAASTKTTLSIAV